jgi:hypothetical protein
MRLVLINGEVAQLKLIIIFTKRTAQLVEIPLGLAQRASQETPTVFA